MPTSRVRAVLVGGLVLAVLARTTVFWRGGLGGLISVAIFYAFAAALVIAAVLYLAQGTERREKVRWRWTLAAIASIALTLATSGTWENVGIAFLFICLLALVILWLQTVWRAERSRPREVGTDNRQMARVDLRAPIVVMLVALLLLLFTAGGLPALALGVVVVGAAVIVTAVVLARLWQRLRA